MNKEQALRKIRIYYGVSTPDAERILRERGEVVTMTGNTTAVVLTIGGLIIMVVISIAWLYLKQRVIGYKVVK